MASWHQAIETYEQRTFTGELPRHFQPSANHPTTGCMVFAHGGTFTLLHSTMERARCLSRREVETTLAQWEVPAHEGWS